MAALVRMFAAAILACVLVLMPRAAQAQPQPLTLPSDVPAMGPGEAVVPAIPSTWQTRDLGWLKMSYPPEAKDRVAPLLRDADAIRTAYAGVFGEDVLGHVEVRITPTVAEMKELAPVGSPPPAYASGVAYPRLHLVLISMFAPKGADATPLDDVFRHELAHVALEDATLGQHVPVWFNEGLAVQLAGENSFDRQDTLFHATIYGNLIPLADLDRSMPRESSAVNVAYAESADFLRFLRARTDLLRFASMIKRVRDGQPFERALADSYSADLRKLEFQWRSEVERRYSVIPILTGGGIIWVAVIVALGYGYVKKRRRAKAILAKWAAEEAIEDALYARRVREEAEATEAAERDLVRVGIRASRAPTKFEHEGDWHTLH